MTKIQKTGPDGKLHYYWRLSEEEIVKTREIMNKQLEEIEKRRSGHAEALSACS